MILKKYTYQIQGFTLLETLTSIGILAMVIIGPLAVIVESSSYARQTKDMIIASYLAEESIELLQNQYNSLYIYCQKIPEDEFCVPSASETTVGQAVWRQFKDRLGPVGLLPSCYTGDNPDGSAGNPNGCSFDYFSTHTVSTTTPPTRYDAASSSCPYALAISTTTTIVDSFPNACHLEYEAQSALTLGDFAYQYCQTNPGPGGASSCEANCMDNVPTETPRQVKRNYYACKQTAEAMAATGGILGIRPFTRSIGIEQVSTFESGLPNTQYNDDLRVTSMVRFKGVNGLSHTVKVIRFMHALP